ncbi:MAG: hypothetical protein N4A49_09920 [Marinifilaceae bacterium]|jgi:hypothetical protein|nr:hypothetical protein [Marinifilaceae bacterium]
MEKKLGHIIKKVRNYLFRNGLSNLSFEQLNEFGIDTELLQEYVGDIRGLVGAVLEYERRSFESIFRQHNFDGMNAIEILFTVSQEIYERYEHLTPSITMEFNEIFPELYNEHMTYRMGFIYDKILINMQKGIAQGMYRSDLSIEMLGRMYLAKLEDMHNTDLYPPDRFKFGTIYDVMIDSFIKSIATEDGLNFYKHRKQLLSVLSFGR